MKYIDEFRNPEAARALRGHIQDLAARLPPAGHPVRIMEVCGSHTMAIARFGIRGVLPGNIDLISGPGCPVCVTPAGYVDTAIRLAGRGAIVVTFGDMLHVPGSEASLAASRAAGADIRVAYSPLTAADLAAAHPDRQVVFLAIGFETTMAPVVMLAETAVTRGLRNLSLLTAFKLVPPALAALLDDPALAIDAFLCPAHVSAIIGADAYQPVVDRYRVPCVIAGFEPLDILYGIAGILRQVVDGRPVVENQYSRVVRPGPNRKAEALFARYLEPYDAPWRGIGIIPASGMRLQPRFGGLDAEQVFGETVGMGREPAGCRCGDVIKGKQQPQDCPLFGTRCTPDAAVGPCMVSSEGSCAASYKYGQGHPRP